MEVPPLLKLQILRHGNSVSDALTCHYCNWYRWSRRNCDLRLIVSDVIGRHATCERVITASAAIRKLSSIRCSTASTHRPQNNIVAAHATWDELSAKGQPPSRMSSVSSATVKIASYQTVNQHATSSFANCVMPFAFAQLDRVYTIIGLYEFYLGRQDTYNILRYV